MLPHMITAAQITVSYEGRPYTVNADEAHFTDLRQAIQDRRWDDVPGLLTAEQIFRDQYLNQVTKFTDGEVTIEDGEVTFTGYVVRSSVTDKIVSLFEEGFDVTPLTRFLARVQNNPLITAREELYDFCEANGFMIDEDGFIIAYKKVNNRGFDIYTNTMDNNVGQVVSMPREDVDPDRANECSVGLHFAAYGYAQNSYGTASANRLMVVRVDPADVVAVPQDYGRQKGRAWRYQVIAEITDGQPLEQKTFSADDFEIQADVLDDGAEVTELSVADAALADRITQALINASWVVAGANGAAQALGYPESTLRGIMKRLDISRP